MNCWEKRGCDDEMMGRCPHVSETVYSPCPADCNFSFCDNPQHVVATDLSIILDPTIDREAVIKEQCMYCEHFLTNGPRLSEAI